LWWLWWKRSCPESCWYVGRMLWGFLGVCFHFKYFSGCVLTSLCGRKRPRSTYVNKRFLSRTVSSAARYSVSRDRATVPAAGSHASRDEDGETWLQHNSGVPRRRTAMSRHPRRGTAAVKTATDKRKHSADSRRSTSDAASDQEHSDVYDVHDYMRLNKQYRLQKQCETIADPSSHGISAYCSARRSKWSGFLSVRARS